MKKLCYLSLLILFCISCEKNRTPEIVSSKILTEPIVGESIVTINVVANDVDEDLLTYTWTTNGGTFVSGIYSSVVEWKAPTSVDTLSYTLNVEITDGEFVVNEDVVVIVEGGRFMDTRDSTIYKFVQIGTQVWMAENLSYLPSVCGPDQGSNYDPLYYVYGFNGTDLSLAKTDDLYERLGVLYNWEAVQSACPIGWHLPSDEEWNNLELFLGMESSELDDIGWRDSGKVGKKLKKISGWKDNGNGIDSYGFNGTGGGCRFIDGLFYHIDVCGDYWTSTPSGPSLIWGRGLGNDSDGMLREVVTKVWGVSVRCIKD